MEQDEVVREIREIRQRYAEAFDFDLEAIYRDLKNEETQSGRPVVRLDPRPVEDVKRAS